MEDQRSPKEALAELTELLDGLGTRTLTDKKVAAFQARFDKVTAGMKALERDWVKAPPNKYEVGPYEERWAVLFSAFEKTYNDIIAACSSDADFFVANINLLGESLDQHAAVLMRIFDLPLAFRTSRVTGTAKPARNSEYAPSVRAALREAAARPPVERPEGDSK
jgi:hypothetical protein